MSFSHVAVYGMTGQGKSTLAKAMVAEMRQRGWPVLLYSPTLEAGWPPGCTVVWNADGLEAALNDPANAHAHVVIDEAAFLRKEFRPNKHITIATLGNMGRHRGFTVWALTQFPTSMDHALRWNCATCYCFKLANADHAKTVWEDFNSQSINGMPVWEAILKLAPLTCIKLTRESAEFLDIHHLLNQTTGRADKPAQKRTGLRQLNSEGRNEGKKGAKK